MGPGRLGTGGEKALGPLDGPWDASAKPLGGAATPQQDGAGSSAVGVEGGDRRGDGEASLLPPLPSSAFLAPPLGVAWL